MTLGKGLEFPEVTLWQVKEDWNLLMKSWCSPFGTASLLLLRMVDELFSIRNHVRSSVGSQV